MAPSPSMFVTPPTSPSCDNHLEAPQTPTPKKKSPSASVFRILEMGDGDDELDLGNAADLDGEQGDWGSHMPPSESRIIGKRDNFVDDSEGGSPYQQPMSASRAPLSERRRDSNRAPVFHGSFLSDMDDVASEASLSVMVASNKSQHRSPRDSRVRGLHFGDSGEGLLANEDDGDDDDNVGGNISIVPRKQPAHHRHNVSMPAPARVMAAKSPARVPSLNLHRSPARGAGRGQSVSMLVTHQPGPDDSAFLKTRQSMAKTPRGVATNPFQQSPKSTMGSAKKKSRTLFSGRSRYMQDFEERSKIGTGHFSEVYECQHRMDGMIYAVKVLKQELSAPRLTKVMCEVFALAALPAHDNLIRYYGCWTDNNRLYIQTELCEAGNLDSKFKGEHRFTEEQLCDVVRQVGAGLAHIHKGGLCHLDIKPENILVTYVKHGVAREPVYKIGDLGLVMKSDLKDKIHTDVEGGDGRYMSPELMEGDTDKLTGNLEKSDVWSLGCSVYALARRCELPVGGDEYQEIRAGKIRLPENEYSPAFVELLKCMICPNVQDRLTAAQLLRQPLLMTKDTRRYKHAKA